MSGTIFVVGIGPGSTEHTTLAARDAIEIADVILGYRTYLRLIEDLAPGVPREATSMGQEVDRVKRAVELARAGKRVVLISSGDAGIYGMAGLVYEIIREQDDGGVVVEVVPGMPALSAAAALLGAPLMNDFAVVSLSDLLTPLDDILRRVEMAARADFVLCLYNPKARHRSEPFDRACHILAQYRSLRTPVGIVRSAYRTGQQVDIISLAELAAAEVDMTTIIVIGNSHTYDGGGVMVTPRGYGGKYDLSGGS